MLPKGELLLSSTKPLAASLSFLLNINPGGKSLPELELDEDAAAAAPPSVFVK